jgi:FkbM family methyltransferase
MDLFLSDYPLTPDSVVMDVGGYHGLWTELTIERKGFSPNVYVFEPVPDWYADIKNKFNGNSKIQVFNFGLAGADRKDTFEINRDSTGAWARSSDGASVDVSIRDIAGVLKELGLEKVDLITINCEGGEYAILERLLTTGTISDFKYVQVQYHNLFSESSDKRDWIRQALSATHREKYNIPWTWESWERK